MKVSEADFAQRNWQRILIKLGIVTRARDRPDVYDAADVVRLQQRNKLIKRARGMPDR